MWSADTQSATLPSAEPEPGKIWLILIPMSQFTGRFSASAVFSGITFQCSWWHGWGVNFRTQPTRKATRTNLIYLCEKSKWLISAASYCQCVPCHWMSLGCILRVMTKQGAKQRWSGSKGQRPPAKSCFAQSDSVNHRTIPREVTWQPACKLKDLGAARSTPSIHDLGMVSLVWWGGDAKLTNSEWQH
jgi:hypothetical protein